MTLPRRTLKPKDQAVHYMHAAVLGWPIDHSLSPRLHNYWLKKYGIDGDYEKIAVEPQDLEKTLRELAQRGYRGVNLTVPHKEAALKIVDEIDPLAERVGAVNTVVMQKDGKLIGLNTDVFGFHENLRTHRFRLNNRKVAILGAGGASRAAIVALLDMGAEEIRIINRTLDRASKLASIFGHRITVHQWNEEDLFEDIALLVNATPMGLKGQPKMKLSMDTIPEQVTITDMVYTPLKTEFLRRAQGNGNPVIDGLGMLLHQAKPAFKAFFGMDPEVTPALRTHVIAGMHG